ncbi:hypothetical protein RJ641_011336 [Dillenia turbinata]|uniref:Uncharacterized protein n=1 Tax=Dillenia turbinata TaxID=194707 RepID=A0AAN8V5D2_9MAGN
MSNSLLQTHLHNATFNFESSFSYTIVLTYAIGCYSYCLKWDNFGGLGFDALVEFGVLMANPGVGTKFVSVNLNKSYGQQPHHQNPFHGSSGAGSNRIRTGHGGGGGGMVVLSRARSSQKVGPKLSVPPPLNLPSLRKEHERFDSSGFGGGTGGGGSSGSGSRPSSSGLGWTKPGTFALQEKDGGRIGADNEGVVDGVDQHGDSVSRGSSVYMPPSMRSSSAVGIPVSAPAQATIPGEKAVVLKGEDFPSLRAALPAMSGPAQKQKDGLQQKQKFTVDDQLSSVQRESSNSNLHLDMRPNANSSHRPASSGTSENTGGGYGLGSSLHVEQSRKQEEYFPSPLPLVRLNPRSDWEDDERDTGNGFASRERDHGFSKSEAYWEKDFDLPRGGFLPHKPLQKPFDRWAQREDEAGKVSSGEVSRVEPYGKDIRSPSREGREANSWKGSSLQKEVPKAQELTSNRNGVGTRPSIMNEEQSKERQSQLSFGETVRDNFNVGVTGNKDPTSGRRDLGYGQGARQPWNNTMESLSSRVAERNGRDRYGNEQPNRYRGDTFLNNLVSKTSFSTGSKGLPLNDPILNFGREKRSSSKSEKPYTEDPFLKDFGDGRDPFSMGLVGVVKRKKDVQKQTDFHDPVRESFEAELERVQKMQEQERQRIIEEQEKALELARKEEEERARLAKEQEEQQRRLEEEAREAAWRAEQEQMEAMQRAEEQRIAREEEKQRILMEEERRKQAAKQKLLELEARMAKRQAETAKGDGLSAPFMDEKASGFITERDVPKATDLGDWEDGERMVQRITTSESSDSSGLTRHTETGSRPHPSTNGSYQFLDRGRPVNSWRRDVFDNGNGSTFFLQDRENSHHSPRRDASGGGRAFPRKDYYGGAGFVSSRNSFRGGLPEPPMDDFNQFKGQRWAFAGDGEQYGRNTELESEFHDNFAERYGDMGWGQGRSRGYAHPHFAERMYQNSEGDGPYSSGRSRYSMRQPRVLPPPSVSSMHRISYRGGENDHPGPSSFLESEMHFNRASEIHFNHVARSEPTTQTGYDATNQENFDHLEVTDIQQENAETERILSGDAVPRCDSQSSLSVSSPPSSPTHLSHDDLDESEDSLVLLPPAEGKDAPLSGNGPILVPTKTEKENMIRTSSSISLGDDEEWTIENNEELQEQEEYDDNEDGYHEEDEVHGGDDENFDLDREFEVMHLEEKGSPLDLGFHESVEVEMPGEDPERISRNEEGIFGAPQVSACLVEDCESFNGIDDAEPVPQPVDDSADTSIDGFSRKIQDPEMTIQDLAAQHNVASHTSGTSDLLEPLDSSSGLEVSVLHVVPSSVNMPLHSAPSQNVVPSVPTTPSQAELPVKLQFGLFSGPPLIPSPVPAIQIGSIQMPLHLHPPVGGPSLAHMHPSQPPLFQFGQLRYTSPISQGILPFAHQPVSFIQPNLLANYPLNQNSGGPLPTQSSKDTFAHSIIKDEVQSSSRNNQSGLLSRQLDPSQEKASKELNYLPVREGVENNVLMCQSQQEFSHIVQNKNTSGSVLQAEDLEARSAENNLTPLDSRQAESLVENGATSRSHPSERGFNLPRFQGPVMSSKGKKFIITVKNPGTRSSLAVSEASQSDSTEFQRRPRRNFQRVEFRVRENTDRRQSSGLGSSNHSGPDSRSNFNGRNAGMVIRSGSRRSALPGKPLKQMPESESMNSDPVTSQETNSESRTEKGSGKYASAKGQNLSRPGDGHLKRSVSSEQDVDAPVQSGIVRVFKQPGIETPSDEDDFIEVRSKRQMREQREKEIKAKSRVTKTMRKPRPTSQSTIISSNSNKNSMSFGGEVGKNTHTDFLVTEGHGLGKVDISTGKNRTTLSQPLAPIGTPAVNIDAQNDIMAHNVKSFQTSSICAVSSGKNLGSGIILETKNKALDGASTPLGSWGDTRINQQVMALTQTQLDEAMKPGPFDTHVGSIGDHASSICGPSMPSSSILTKEKSFSSVTSPINSLLAGEKIQFGAVTSPTILPPSSCAVAYAIGPPGSCLSDIQISHSLSAAEDECSLFFGKGKHPNESCVPLEDCEAEAEAAASAVAVAAIGNDEIIGNGLETSALDGKSFEGEDIEGITTGVTGDKQSAIQSRNDESLSVSLPADLSVETPSISSWQPLPTPQNSSSQMISHIPGGTPSHFPFYEMNPMLGGPIFAFGPHDEPAGSQSESQKSNPSGSGPAGAWPHHSGIDSFYGPPAGFTGPFISPPGSIAGVQGAPHMVVYNHFAPVGQFGQVGLSFMGTTYIPSGKQPDWMHNPTSSAMGAGEGDMNNLSMVSAQWNSSNVPHLAPGSPLLPMASPMAVFDASPFQSSTDMSVQTRWSHIPNAPLHTGSLAMPLQQQPEGVLPPFSHGLAVEQSISISRFQEARTSTPSDGGRNFSLMTDAAITRFPEDLGLVESSNPTNGEATTQNAPAQNSSGNTIADVGKNEAAQNGKSSHTSGQNTSSAFTVQTSQPKNSTSQQYSHPSGYNYQRGVSQKNSSGGEWSHRRTGFQHRNQSSGAEKSYPSSKMKQIYVAKQQPASGT